MSIAASAMKQTQPIRIMTKFIHLVNVFFLKAPTGQSLFKIIKTKMIISKAQTDQRVFHAISCPEVQVFRLYNILRVPTLDSLDTIAKKL